MAKEKEIKEEYQDWVDEDIELSEKFSDKINKLFFRMLKNPSDKEIDNFKTIRDTLIVAFILSLMENYKEQLKKAVEIGRNIASEQLKRIKMEKIVKKTINDKKFRDMLDSIVESNKTTISYVLEGIRVNTDNIIKDIKSNVLDTKKVLSTELASEFQKNGITEYEDKAGKKHSISDYIKQKSLDEITKVMRNSYFMEAKRHGVPYVRIVHLNIHPHCALCEPFNNKILALEENDKGVMTLAEASGYGLFHPYCDDVPVEMQLEINYNERDININLNQENKKRKIYNDKKGFKSFFG